MTSIIRTSNLGDISTSVILPPGVIVPFGGSSSPKNWLLCDGSAVSRTTYANLFNAIGTTYGSGDGSTTFNLPDLRGRAPIGSGTGTASGATAKTLGSTPTSGAGGEEKHLLTGSESGTSIHTHPYADNYPNGYYGVSAGSSFSAFVWDYRGDLSRTTTGSTASNAASSHNIMQPYTVVNYIIKI